MRQIKFRAWLKNCQRMVEVEEINFLEGYIVWIDNDYINHEQIKVVDKFEDVILMQSMGLFDKNGVEIYEGDIIDVGTRIPFLNKIQKDEETNYLKLVPIDKRWSESYFTSFEDKSRFEILGNIYENPELMEEYDA